FNWKNLTAALLRRPSVAWPAALPTNPDPAARAHCQSPPRQGIFGGNGIFHSFLFRGAGSLEKGGGRCGVPSDRRGGALGRAGPPLVLALPLAPAAAQPPLQPRDIQEPPHQRPVRRDPAGDPLPPGAIARLGTLRFRYPGRVHAVAFLPDGKTLLSGNGDGTV